LSHKETFGTDDLDPTPPFDLNSPTHVSTNEGIVNDHAKVQDRLDEEVDVHLNNDNARLKNATLIDKEIYNDFDPQDCQYDADSRENEEPKDDDDVMIDEEHEIHEAKVEVYLFGLKESDYQFTTIDVSSKVVSGDGLGGGDVSLISSKGFPAW
ncbi:hypothetical protein Tco_1423583, partial [Tanacetum coccineum]